MAGPEFKLDSIVATLGVGEHLVKFENSNPPIYVKIETANLLEYFPNLVCMYYGCNNWDR